MKRVMITQLRVAHEHKYEVVVLGAFGCGAFCNPPDLIARLYKEVIDTHFHGVFKKILFPIRDNTPKEAHNPQGNLLPFQKVFGGN